MGMGGCVFFLNLKHGISGLKIQCRNLEKKFDPSHFGKTARFHRLGVLFFLARYLNG